MAIYLAQHGKSLPKDADPQQGISDVGRAEVERIAAVARGYGVGVAAIVHSGKMRASQTAEIFASAFEIPDKVTACIGLKPLDDVTEFAATLNPGDNLMAVGHLPFMERLTSYLGTKNAEIIVFKFQNGGIVCLDQDSEGSPWYIKWALMPIIE